MMARSIRIVSVGLLTCAFVLGGCSKATPERPPRSSSSTSGSATTGSSASSPAAAQSGDELLARSGSFTVVPPEGWTEATDKANAIPDVDLVLLSSKKVDAFANNLVVTATKGDPSVLQDELAKGRAQLSAAGRAVSSAPDRAVAGTTAVGFTTTFEQQGIKVVARSYGLLRGGRIYLLTLSSSQGDATHAMAEFDELLSTWTWT